MTKRVPIVPFETDGLKHDIIQVTIDYDKKATGPVITLQTASTEDGSFKFSIFGSPRAFVTYDAGWKSNNAKKMAQAREAVSRDLDAKNGRAWEAVKDFAAKKGITLAVDADDLAACHAEELEAGGDNGFDR